MISTSPAAKITSLLLASVIVVGGMQLSSTESPEIQGAGVASEAMMGSSFEDMVVGTLVPETTTETTKVEPPQEVVEPVETAQEAPSKPVETTQQVEPAPITPQAEPVQTTYQAQPVQPTEQIIQSTIAPPPPSPEAIVALSPEVVASPSIPITSATTVEPPKTMAALTPETTAPPKSMRPKRKDPVKAAKVAQSQPKPKQKVAKAKVTKKTPKPTKAKRGNAQKNKTKGSENGTSQTAKAKSKGTSKRASSKSGNAAVSNYPGQVMRRISRVRKPNVNSRGTATVAFAISSGGGLSRVSISRSSGSAALDKAALRVVQKAAPFPAPPKGAKRQYFIHVKGR